MFWAGNANAAINVAVIAPQVGEFKHFGDELINGGGELPSTTSILKAGLKESA